VIGASIPLIEQEWLTFRTRVVDRAIKLFPEMMTPQLALMLHDAFYAGALSVYAMDKKMGDAEWTQLGRQIEAYYHEAVRRKTADQTPA
jgi:hypothetical protein